MGENYQMPNHSYVALSDLYVLMLLSVHV